ncbi:MAG: hypothetical protein HC828_09135 [Blastochloris sp.]|nr:hypothetical protein [Blastochloris sp.]
MNALTLIAEAATHAGVDLWRYQVRGVSLVTAGLYPIYFFYTTIKWKWEPISPESVQSSFARHGGYLEMLYARTRSKDLKILLDELRPIYDARAGGLTTLSHGVVEKKRRSLFG